MEHVVKVQPKALVTSNTYKVWPSAACENGWITSASVPQSLASLVLNGRMLMPNTPNQKTGETGDVTA